MASGKSSADLSDNGGRRFRGVEPYQFATLKTGGTSTLELQFLSDSGSLRGQPRIILEDNSAGKGYI